jgi:O-antigen ligase
LQVVLALLVFVQVWRMQDLLPGIAIPGLPVVSSLAVLLLLVLDRHPRRRLDSLKQPVVRAALALLVLATLSIPGSLYPRYSLNFLVMDYMRSVALMLMIAASVRGVGDLRRLAWVQIVGVTLFCAVSVARGQVDGDGRLVVHTYYNSNDLALLIASTLPLTLYVWRRPTGLVGRAVLLAATSCAVMTLGRTGSRGGFLAFVAVAGYLLAGFRGIATSKRVAAVALLAILLVALASDRYFARIQTILNPSADYNWRGKSETGRMEIWKRGIDYMMTYPVFGVGVAAFPMAEGTLAPEAREQRRYGRSFSWSAAHNPFIQVGAELGVLGLIAFVALLVGAVRTLSKVRRGPPAEPAVLAQSLTACLVGFAVGAFFSSLAYAAYLYMLLGMIVGLARTASPRQGHVPDP